jgi:homocysteine S-methyltransferase
MPSASTTSPKPVDALRAQLQRGRVLLLDGGQATELEKDPRVDLSQTCLWSAALLLDRFADVQEVVTTVHKNYFLAGADAATTASYQASLEGFQREREAATLSDMEPFYAKSIALAAIARDDAWGSLQHTDTTRVKPLVAGSLGCYGAALADGSVR